MVLAILSEATGVKQDKIREEAASFQVYDDLRAALQSGRGDDTWTSRWHVTLGALAGLLIAKWAGCNEALRLPHGDQLIEDHASALLAALGEETSRRGAPRDLEPVELPVMAAATKMPEMYRAIIGWLRGIDLGSSHGLRVAAGAFDAAVRFVVHRNGRHAGEFITPLRVADLMLDLAKPTSEETVYDPCFGCGELLVGAARRLGTAALSSSAKASTHGFSIFGVEIGPSQYAIGLCRLLLSGVSRHGLKYGDALDGHLPGEHPADGFDCILTVPPWGRWSSGSESQFLRHVMSRLRPGGRAVVAMSEGTLFKSGSDERVRKALLSEFSVEGVVALPPDAFAPYTSLPGSLVVFYRSEPRTTVCFASVSSAAWEAAAPEGGDAETGRSGLAMPLADGAGMPLSSTAELSRAISRVVAQPLEGPLDVDVPGVEVWQASVRELEERRHELIAKKSGGEMLDAEIQRLVAASATLKFEGLQNVAEVHAGIHYDRNCSIERHTAPEVVAGLIRVGDVTDKEVRAASVFFTGNANSQMHERALLRFGDVVVTTSGTVGKVGFIAADSASVGALASHGMVVIRVREGVKPQFVAALLRSPIYQNWLLGHARGLVIQHLSIRVLRTLRIPVPPVDIQDAVLRELGGPSGDALAVLLRVLSGKAHPVTIWLETPVAARLVARAPDEDDRLSTLEKIAAELQSIVVPDALEAGSADADERSIGKWLAIVRNAAAALHGIVSVPNGSGRLAILELSLAIFYEALGVLDRSETPTHDRLQSFTRAMVTLVDREVYAMQRSITLDIEVDPVEVVAGDTSEVVVRATNASAVPLRNVHVTARRPDGTTEEKAADYVAERGTHDLSIAVRPTGEERSLQIAVEWQARRFDGKPVRGDGAVSLLVRENRTKYRTGAEDGDLGESPYIVGNPVGRDEMFFGRADQMGQIRRQLGGGDHANVILLEGNRRTGKTSILRQLGKADALPGWIPVYCSFQDVDSVATADVFRLLARQTGWTLADAGIETWIPDLPRPDSGIPFKLAFRAALHRAFSGGHPFETLEVYLATVIEAAKPRRILLMLDEFDKLQEGIDGGITSPQVPENIRHLLQHQPGFGAIITGSRRLKRLREEYWSALFGFGYRIGVSALPKDGARRLVTKPVAGRLRYLQQAVDRLVELCACHPFLIQSLCSRVFDQAATGSDRTITLDIVERAATEMVRDNEHFQTLWGYAGTERRRLILALCDRLAAGSDPVNIHLLRTEFDGYGLPVRRDRDLADDIAELRELELVYVDTSYRNGTYRLSVPLMAKWLKRNVDFDDLVVRAKQEAEGAL